MFAQVQRFWAEYIAIRYLLLICDVGAVQFASSYRLAGQPE
jgi:hypothetical protein